MSAPKETNLCDDAISLLNLNRLPARLTSDQVAAMLGCQKHDVPTLMRARMLKPLGNPNGNAVKYFSMVEIEKRVRNLTWLNRATKVLYGRWINHNAKRKSQPADSVLN